MARRRGRRTRRGGALGWLGEQLRERPRPIWMVCVAHVLALGVALLLYALPHHVIPRSDVSIGVVSSRGGGIQTAREAPTEAPAETPQSVEAEPEATPTPEPTQDPSTVGNFREKFADKFTDGAVEYTDTTYRSANLNVAMYSKYSNDMKAWIYLADIYVADISCLTTSFGKDQYGRGYLEWITDIASRYQSVVTLNGDYYGARDTGVVIRNGTLYRDNKTTFDIAILYWDGHMETFTADAFDAMTEMNRGAYQSWCFGPALLDDAGAPIQVFNYSYSMIRKNPRSAIGYFEPGHYCFVAVDGRNDESRGARISQLAELMSSLGCQRALNLDGGQTSLLAFGTKLFNSPSDGGRSSSDYIMIVDRVS